jgi:hypothetical protein
LGGSGWGLGFGAVCGGDEFKVDSIGGLDISRLTSA